MPYKRETEIFNAIYAAKLAGATVAEIATAIGRSQTIVRKWLYAYMGQLMSGVVEFKIGSGKVYVASSFAAIKAIDIARTNESGALPPLPPNVIERMTAQHWASRQRVYLGGDNWLDAYFPTHDGFEALEAHNGIQI